MTHFRHLIDVLMCKPGEWWRVSAATPISVCMRTMLGRPNVVTNEQLGMHWLSYVIAKYISQVTWADTPQAQATSRYVYMCLLCNALCEYEPTATRNV